MIGVPLTLAPEHRMRVYLMCCALLLPALAVGAERYSSYAGSAVGYKDATALYDETHFLRYDDDSLVERVVLYRCPGGAPFARKRMQSAGPALRPTFELRDARIGYVEGYRSDGKDHAVYFQRGTKQALETETLKLPDELVVDAGFDEFVRQRWDTLMSGKKLSFDFLVPSRLDYLSFKVQHIRADREDGVPAQVFRLSLTGVLGWFLDGIDVWYADGDRSLLRFDGLSNMRDEAGENYMVRIRFPRAAIQAQSTAEAFQEASELELVQTCTS
jgi:hypothetical protein